MKNRFYRLSALLLALSVLLCLPAPAFADALSVTLTHSSLVQQMGAAESVIVATANDNNAVFNWSSSPAGIVTVSGDGNTATVAAVKPGAAVITVTASVGASHAEATCTVTVPDVPVDTVTISRYADGSYIPLSDGEVYHLDIKPDSGSFSGENSVTLKASHAPGYANTPVTYTWTVYRKNAAGIPGGATVYTGDEITLTSLQAGDTVVRVVASNAAGSAAAECVISVNSLDLSELAILYNGDTVGSSSSPLAPGTGSFTSLDVRSYITLTPELSPSNATVSNVSWSSSDVSIVSVSGDSTGCTVLAQGTGTAVITAEAGGLSAQCRITVNPEEVGDITLSHSTATLATGTNTTLRSSVYYMNGALTNSASVTWYTDDDSMVKLSSTTNACVVTALNKAGACNVYARVLTTESAVRKLLNITDPGIPTPTDKATLEPKRIQLIDGSYYLFDSCIVTVTQTPVSYITLIPGSLQYINASETLGFRTTFIPSTAQGTVEWQNSNDAAATLASGTGDTNTLTPAVSASGASLVSPGDPGGARYTPGETVVKARVQSSAGSETDADGVKWATASCKVEISGIVLDEQSLVLAVGETAQVSVAKTYGAAKASSASDQTWSLANSSDANYISVNPTNGLITAKVETISPITVICNQGGFAAVVTVTVRDASSKSIPRTVRSGETLSFDTIPAEFESLSYLSGLSVPADQGTLYYGYVSANSPGSGVSSADKFYSDSNTSHKQIGKITFVPAAGFVGTATVSYTLTPASGQVSNGVILVTVLDPTAISYVSENGEAIYFRTDDFAAYAKAKYGYTVRSVRFTAPDSRYGWLYANYSGGEVYGSNITDDKRFYANSTPSIDTLCFIPKEGYSGTFNISFEMVDGNNKTYSGVVQITVKRASGESAGDIAYTAYVGDRLYFDPADFQQISSAAGLGTLTYVTFDVGALPNDSKVGNTYHNTTKVSSGNFYSSSAGHTNEFLGNVNFLPAAVGKVEIPFTAVHYDSALDQRKTATGKVVITVLENDGRATTINYTTTGMPVGFVRSDFTTACKRALSGSLVSVSFELPSSSVGTLYESFQDIHTNKPLAAQNSVDAADLIKVTFVPKGGTEGSAYISYTAKDSSGNTCTGSVRVFVDPNTTSQYFRDSTPSSYGWAASALDFLRRYNVVGGRSDTVYDPAAAISRGDFTLMLYRAFDFPDNGASSFSDVPADSYYAVAIAAAQARGIAQGSGGKFRPTASISRQDAAVLLYRSLQSRGEVAAGSIYSLNSFSDGGQVAGYAQEAMAAMVELGVFKGDNGRLKPTGTLTRAEMAVILYRALT